MVASSKNDNVNWYAHDAPTNKGVVRAPGTSGPDAGVTFSLDPIIGPDGNLYVSGYTSGNIVRYNPTTGAFIDEFADGAALVPPGTQAVGMAFGPDGNLYVAYTDTGEVLRYSGTTGAFIDAFVTANLGGIDLAEGLTFGPDGNLYVSDYADTGTGNAVYRYDGSTGAFINKFVASGSNGLQRPEDLFFGPDGHLYVVDEKNHRVQRYNGTTGASLGVFAGPGNGMQFPIGGGFGPDGNLYVGSFDENTVQALQRDDRST